MNEIITQGYNPIYGARILKRIITQLLENPLATFILSCQFDTNHNIQADFIDKKVIFK